MDIMRDPPPVEPLVSPTGGGALGRQSVVPAEAESIGWRLATEIEGFLERSECGRPRQPGKTQWLSHARMHPIPQPNERMQPPRVLPSFLCKACGCELEADAVNSCQSRNLAARQTGAGRFAARIRQEPDTGVRIDVKPRNERLERGSHDAGPREVDETGSSALSRRVLPARSATRARSSCARS